MLFALFIALTGCDNKEKKSGQTLVRVNGEEITVHLMNDELKRAGIQDSQFEENQQQFIENLIDRQLIIAEAMRNKIERTPEVMQSIEHARAQIIAQAYLQSIAAKVTKPSQAEINDYYQKHPQFFSKRREFELKQIVISAQNFTPDLKAFMDEAKSLDDVAAWMDTHGIEYTRGQVIRSTADLPATSVEKLMSLPKGKMFLVSDGGNKVLNIVLAIKERPISAKSAEIQIERFLTNQRYKESADLEVKHLRSLAKIEYINASAPAATPSLNNKQ